MRDLVVALHRDDAAHHAVDQQRHQDRREGELDVGDAHDQRVDRAAEIAAEQAERDAEHHGDDHRREAHLSDRRVPYMIDDRMSRPWSSVPSGKAQSPSARQQHGRLQPVAEAERGRIERRVRRQHRREEGRGDDEERDRRRGHRHRRGLEAPPDVAVGHPMQPSRQGRARRHLSAPPRARRRPRRAGADRRRNRAGRPRG